MVSVEQSRLKTQDRCKGLSEVSRTPDVTWPGAAATFMWWFCGGVSGATAFPAKSSAGPDL